MTDSSSLSQERKDGKTDDVRREADRSTIFREIYRAEVRYIWNGLRRLGVAERDLADKVHDVFVVVFRRLDTYDASRPVRPWLMGIAIRVVSDYRRSAYQRREQVQAEVKVVDPELSPEGLAAQQEARDFVLAGLATLPSEQRDALVLCDIEQHTGPEVAQMLELPLNTLYSRLRLARSAFAAAMRRMSATRGRR